MPKERKLILVGDSAFAEVAFEYFTHDSPYEVVAFAVERDYLTRPEMFARPVMALEDLPSKYSPADHWFYAAIVYTQLNRLRARLYHKTKSLGYQPASYISPRAFAWRNAKFGEHCFVFENNVIQPFVTIGNNVVLWSGNHIGHHSKIGDHCFVSSHVVISGFVDVGPSCFFGVNAAIGNDVRIGADCLIGAGATVVKDIADDVLVRGNLSDLSKPLSARRFCKVTGEAA